MSEWGVALIAAGSAVAGSIVTGWYTRSAGIRQAEAAKHAGDRQADALLHTVRATLDDQRLARMEDRRRQTYIAFLEVVDDLSRDSQSLELFRKMNDALVHVSIEGPQPVVAAALEYGRLAFTWDSDRNLLQPLVEARTTYIAAVRTALNLSDGTPIRLPFNPFIGG
ncbi:hypothetical protein ACFW1F_07605 [Streptomyces bungoensis]|uniref:hypothetical protein n=1 Tax=Streptomyces bungoensis TaxID=285568 RepID=UPI0036C2BFB7